LQLCAGDDAKFSRLLIRFAALAFAVYQPNKIVLGNTGAVGDSYELCPQKAARWFIFAPAIRASRRQVKLKK
jgi:hypothetical protein